MLRPPLLLLTLLALLLHATPALAEEPAAPANVDGAKAPVATFYAALEASMQAGAALSFEARKAQLAPVVTKTFDLPLMAAKVLGRHWRPLAPADQKRWVDAFASLTVKTYAEQFNENSGLRFEVVSAQAAPAGTALVRTKLKRASDEPVAIDYRLRPVAGGWRVIDIFLNGTVSELALRRSEYTSVLERDGFGPLVVSLQTRSLVPASQAKD